MAKKNKNKKQQVKKLSSNKKIVVKNDVKKAVKPKSKFAPKRSPGQKSKDRLEIIEHYLTGKHYRDIAKIISSERNYSISHATVGTDVKIILNEYKKTREDKFELYLTIELAKIDKIECEYWEAWEKSKVNFKQESGKNGYTLRGNYEEESFKEIVEYGDPRFLQGIERCVQKRIDLLGLEAAKTLNIKTVSETTVFRVKTKQLDDVSMKKVS
jgi:hypothetical protein